MADELKVDTGVLSDLSNRLGRVSDRLVETGRKVDAHADDLGSGEVLRAVRGFEDHWSGGRRKISEKVESLKGMLEDSAAEFESVDAEVAESLGTQGSSSHVGGGM